MAKILIIDHDKDDAKKAAKALVSAGHICRIQLKGEGSVEASRKEPPDMVIVNAMLPGMSGFQVCRSFRKDDRLYKIPMMIVSEMNDAEEVEYGLKHGADSYLSKPCPAASLVKSVEDLLQEHNNKTDLGTGLPDSPDTKREVRHRIIRGDGFGLVYVEILNLQGMPDAAGQAGREKATRNVARALEYYAERAKIDDFFLGLLGAGHFLCIVPKESAEKYCRMAYKGWRGQLRRLYRSLDIDKAYKMASSEPGGENSLLDLLICVTTCHPAEFSSMQSLLDIVSRIRNNSAQNGLGGIHVDRRVCR